MLRTMNEAALALIGERGSPHRLFDVMAAMPAATSARDRVAALARERYVGNGWR